MKQDEAGRGGTSETVSILGIGTLAARETTVAAAKAEAISALSAARLANPSDMDAGFRRVLKLATQDQAAAEDRVAAAATKAMQGGGEIEWSALQEAAFDLEIASAKVEAIRISDAETALHATGDERKLAKLGKLGRRGRPRSVSDAKISQGGWLPENVTPRTRVDAHYRSGGLMALEPAGTSLKEFYLGPKIGQPGKNNYRKGALTELGRISEKFGAAVAREVAEQVHAAYRTSNKRPRTRDIVADIRGWRMKNEGRKRSNGEDGLYQKLARLLAEHRKMYPTLEADDMLSVMHRVHDDLFA
jgi:hypothetical protein